MITGRMQEMPSRIALRPVLTLSLLLAGCEGRFDDEPLDGGAPLQRITNDAEIEEHRRSDPCSRREPGGWHSSVQHCAEMLPQQRMAGVWITGFEASHFYPAPLRSRMSTTRGGTLTSSRSTRRA